MKALKLLRQNPIVSRKEHLLSSMAMEYRCNGSSMSHSTCSISDEDSEMKDFLEFMESLKNFEKSGVPKGAGTDSVDGFDLGRMRQLMESLDNPLSDFKVIHIAGTKGKGSTAAFISSILRAEGYSVGCYTSPHIRTIRERMSLGRSGEPVSAEALNSLFHEVKERFNKAIELEHGRITHFEALTAMAFKLFSKEKVDIAVIEAGLGGARDATNVISSSGLATSVITTIGEEHLAALGGSLESIAMAKSGIIKHGRPAVFGGPFLPHIEQILRDKASLMSSRVISASEAGRGSKIKGFSLLDGSPYQSCDIVIAQDTELKQRFELFDVKLHMLGSHQLQNAVTATCTALCLRDSGWRVSDESIKSGLENTCLIGRSQFLTTEEAGRLGISKSIVILDGAHTKDSAKALVETIDMAFPGARLALVVAMASDKDHVGFAREFLSGGQVEAVFLTEATIAGAKSRTTSSSDLHDCWTQSAEDLGLAMLDKETTEYRELDEKLVLVSRESVLSSMKLADQFFKGKIRNGRCVIAVTGSLHIVSTVLSTLHS